MRVAIGHVADRYFPIGARSFARLLGADDYQSAGIDFFLHQTGHRYIYVLDDGQGTGYAGAAPTTEGSQRG